MTIYYIHTLFLHSPFYVIMHILVICCNSQFHRRSCLIHHARRTITCHAYRLHHVCLRRFTGFAPFCHFHHRSVIYAPVRALHACHLPSRAFVPPGGTAWVRFYRLLTDALNADSSLLTTVVEFCLRFDYVYRCFTWFCLPCTALFTRITADYTFDYCIWID